MIIEWKAATAFEKQPIAASEASRLDRTAELFGQLLQLLAASHEVLKLIHRDVRLTKGAKRLAAIEDGETVRDGIGMADIVGDEMTPRPLCRTWWMYFSTIEVCATPSAEVGSSRMRILAPK